MGFYDEAVHVLETIAKALNGAFSYAGQEELSEEEEAEQRRLYEEDNEDIPIEGDDDLVF